jgi:uncharacterized 2Fe-2S/4Fe-4S cluster protein (DUF4445 family)
MNKSLSFTSSGVERRVENEDLSGDLSALRPAGGDSGGEPGGAQVIRKEAGEREILGVNPGPRDEMYGLAFDVGSSTVVGYLCSLKTGKVVATQSLMNPQVAYGEDVIARIAYVMDHPDGMEKMRGTIVDGLNRVVLAGAFGSYIDKTEAMILGMFPDCDLQFSLSRRSEMRPATGRESPC